MNPNKKRAESIRIFKRPLRSNRVNFTFGRPEWQQKYMTAMNHFYTPKPLENNREILTADYLKPNYSGFDLVCFPQKQPFLTSNLRDFYPISMKPEDRSKLSEDRIKFLRESKITMGEYTPENSSMYGYFFKAPKNQTPRFNYDKIKFKYNPYNLHPITQQPVWKDPKKMNPFDYYNQDKDKHYVTNKNVPFINTEYRKVWDPITNRFFVGSLRSYSENNKS